MEQVKDVDGQTFLLGSHGEPVVKPRKTRTPLQKDKARCAAMEAAFRKHMLPHLPTRKDKAIKLSYVGNQLRMLDIKITNQDVLHIARACGCQMNIRQCDPFNAAASDWFIWKEPAQ